ncbi:hypothetical protein DOQ08_01018 [Marinobacter litoralis]|uniref:Bacterial extracellular solute-binding protein, family 3 n=1 Tax=Marinobacter litoralis TaxID=187981 RepID=A0A3M2RM33_9GAMM|nr:ABC transporter substrate-binding protein [Marinobacter litoralis]RMJ06331.1 hypothetical protein DOQ08_01018 [Marinobacter litoralis]
MAALNRKRPFKARSLLRLLCAVICLPLAAEVRVTDISKDYTLWYRNYDNPAIHSLVELALKKTPEYGSFRLIRSEELSQGRVLRELASNNSKLVDIANVATSPDRESELTPIPIPVDGGLLGFRVCLVLPENLRKFHGITNIEDLYSRNIRIGQGAHWPDTPILESNGVNVITHTRYEILFGMLKNRRFECYARGVSEVMFEMERDDAKGLVIEPTLLLAYPMPSYLFVAPNDHETAQRIQLGLERAINDGSFAEYLKHSFGESVASLNLNRRTVIALKNPHLTDDSEYVARRILDNLKRRIDYLTDDS